MREVRLKTITLKKNNNSLSFFITLLHFLTHKTCKFSAFVTYLRDSTIQTINLGN